MSQNISMLLYEAGALFSNLNFISSLSEESREGLLKTVVYDLTVIAKVCSLADGAITEDEQMVIAVFLRYPFFSRPEIGILEIWNLLDASERSDILKSVDQALSLAPDKLPETFESVAMVKSLAIKFGQPELSDKYNTHVFRFAQLICKAYAGTCEAESKLLDQLSQAFLVQPAQSFSAADPGKKKKAVEALYAGKISSALQPPSQPKVENSLELELVALEKLIGLKSVKEEVRALVNLLKVQKIREKSGLMAVDVSLHAVFSGPPGTGKTTVARIYSRILNNLGVLSKGHLIETDRTGLVAEYVGQTASKVDHVVTAARGGVLFIDEAYSLSKEGSEGDFGNEAIEALLKRMEDLRTELVVIVAGYSEKMQNFLDSNPGLSSRFPRRIDFPDYSAQELAQIFSSFVSAADYCLSEAAEKKLPALCQSLLDMADPNFGNARSMRNLFEQALRRHANRLVAKPELSKELLETLEAEDLSLSVE